MASDFTAAPIEQHQAALDVMAAVFADVAPWRELVARHLVPASVAS